MKRIVALCLVLALVLAMIPVSAGAADVSFVEVTKNNAPIRTGAKETNKVIDRCAKGTVLTVVGTTYNIYLNKWYKVQWGNTTGYIYSGNATKTHTHSNQKITLAGTTYKICKTCGYATVSGGNVAQGSAVLSSASVAAVLPWLDSPALPFCDIAAGVILVVGACLAADMAVPAMQDLAEMITEADFLDMLKSREDVCSAYSFRRVERLAGKLKYVDSHCLDQVEAYIYVRCLGKDVYTGHEDAALMLAAMHGNARCERDKDAKSYFYHYHLLDDNGGRLPGHIFFGANDFGETPY